MVLSHNDNIGALVSVIHVQLDVQPDVEHCCVSWNMKLRLIGSSLLKVGIRQ